jgi:predicted transcriptional regulator
VIAVRARGELERAVIEVLWRADAPCPVRAVHDELADPDLAYTTVMTVLDRLARKGLVRRERVGRAWHYRAASSREAYIADLMQEALDWADDRDAALVHFARSVSPAEAAVLRASLPDQSGRDRRGGTR